MNEIEGELAGNCAVRLWTPSHGDNACAFQPAANIRQKSLAAFIIVLTNRAKLLTEG